jgi:hypothetical protein
MSEIEEYKTNLETKRTNELNSMADSITALQVGEGLTVTGWSEATAYTIIKKTRTQMVLQEDTAKLIDGWRPEIIPGGFSGHCINQNEQEYTYERNPNGSKTKITLRTWVASNGDERRCWKQAGSGVRSHGGNVRIGRHKFHDYNF